jgi:hypothetical protein
LVRVKVPERLELPRTPYMRSSENPLLRHRVCNPFLLFGLVSIVTMSYPAGAVERLADRRAKKEVTPMMRENGSPANRRLAALRVLLVVALVGLLAAAVVGPGRAIGWVVNDLVPVVLVVGIIFGVYGVAVWGLATLYDKYRHHW